MTERRKIITQGEYFVSDDAGLCISTLLGSCVACCLTDPVAKVGGMNHLLLARHSGTGGDGALLGTNAMERLISAILERGGEKERLQAKVFGGAKMVDGLSNIGAENSSFLIDFLASKEISCIGESLGGNCARHILYWPHSGIVRQKIQRISILSETNQIADPNSGRRGDLIE